MSLFDEYRHQLPWHRGLPADLLPAIKHLRETFDEHHWQYGEVTEKLCYWQLHPGTPDDEIKEYITPIQQIKHRVGSAATQRFVHLLRLKTAPAYFKAYFDLYLDGATVSALAVFARLVAVGKANQHRLSVPPPEWAEAQTKNMIRSQIHLIRMWVPRVCDKQTHTPEDMDEEIHWRKWKAPMLLAMKPSRNMPYDPSREWERNDPETTSRWLDAFAEHYVLHVELRLEKASGQAALELAMQAPPKHAPLPSAPLPKEQLQKVQTPAVSATNARRESQKKATQAKYRRWQTEYKSLKKTHSTKSDVWISDKIARMEIGRGSSAETVRRQMK